MQFFGQGKPSLGVILDANLGDGIDALLALALAHGAEQKNTARVISLSTTKSSIRSAALGDALEKFFAGPPPPPSPNGFSFTRPPAPIGMADNGKLAADTPIINAIAGHYPTIITKLNDTADPVAQIRNAITAQYDDNCAVVLAGPATNLVKVLDLPGVAGLIQAKVKLLSWAVGAFPEGPAGPAFQLDPVAARRLLSDWPTPIVFAGSEAGAAIPYPAASLATKFTYTEHHPIVDAYKAALPQLTDAPAPALAAMLYAIHTDGYFQLSAPGAVTFDSAGRTRFAASEKGRHRYLIADASLKEKVQSMYVDLVSAKPVPRMPRFRRQNADAAAKPEEKKQ